jgi:hypothetical protein
VQSLPGSDISSPWPDKSGRTLTYLSYWSDISGFPGLPCAKRCWPMIDLSSDSHLFLPSIRVMISRSPLIPFWRSWLMKLMDGTPSTVRRPVSPVLARVPPLSPRCSPSIDVLALSVSSPLLRIPLLVVALPTLPRSSSAWRSRPRELTPIGKWSITTKWIQGTSSRSVIKHVRAQPRKGAVMKGFGPSFTMIGSTPYSIERPTQLPWHSGFTLITWIAKRMCTSTWF